MHLCPCGYLGTERCRCTPDMIRRYKDKISGPLLDRIDLQVQVNPVPANDTVSNKTKGESSSQIITRVLAARKAQLERQGKLNGALTGDEIKRHCALATTEQALISRAMERLGLSARAYHRMLKVARTIADLAGRDQIEGPHLSEALGYRFPNRHDSI